jgi:putative hydrolase of the HAD superfamily
MNDFPQSRPTLVIFDMDDVLCRYDLPTRLAHLAELSGRAPDEIRRAVWDSGFEASSDAGVIDAATYLAGFGERLGTRLTRAQWVEARRAAMTPDPRMLALANALRGTARLALLTNNGLLTRETIGDLFPEVAALFGENLFVSAQFKTRKPDPAVYRLLSERIGVAPEGALMIDDKIANVTGAERAGLLGHHFEGIAGLLARLAALGLRFDAPATT